MAAIGLWVQAVIQLPPGKSFIPLHYTIYFGLDLTGRAWEWFIRPALGTFILLLNTWIGVQHKPAMWLRGWLLLSILVMALLSLSQAALILSMK